MKNIFSFGTYSFENSYLHNISRINKHDFAYFLSDIHLAAPYIKFNTQNASSYGLKPTFTSKTKQMYQVLETQLTQISKQPNPLQKIILLCMDICSPYKYPLIYLNNHINPHSSFSLLNIFEDPLFIEDAAYMMKLSWLYNISTKNSPTSLRSVIADFGTFENEKDIYKFSNNFYKAKFDFIKSYSALHSYYEKHPKIGVEPVCIYDLLSTQKDNLYKANPATHQKNFKIDSKYDLPIIFGTLSNCMTNDPLFHIYNTDRTRRLENSFNIATYLDKFFPIKNLSNDNEKLYKSVFDNYLAEKFTNVNFTNCFFNPSFFRENIPFIFEPLFLLSLHPLINFRIGLLKKMLTLPQDTFEFYLKPILNTILHQTFFYFPLLQIIFHLCMLIVRDRLVFPPNKKLIFPKSDPHYYYSYLNNFFLPQALLFTKDENKNIIPINPFPNFEKNINFTCNGETASISQKILHTNVNHSLFKLLQSTLFQIKDMNFIDVAFDYHHKISTSSFTDSVIADFNLAEISTLLKDTPHPNQYIK